MKLLRRIGLALLLSLLVGFAIGTALRLRLERPTLYLGLVTRPLAPDPLPLDVGDARAAVGDPRHHEQQIG